MTDYTKLVAALRCKSLSKQCDSCKYGYRLCPDSECNDACHFEQIVEDAADAIEALQAENPIVESVLVDKMRQQMEETACHCNVKENAELIARILDDDVDGKTFELPKRGEWKLIDEAEPMRWGCSRCKYLSWETSSYCPRCGAKMEVQDDRTD